MPRAAIATLCAARALERAGQLNDAAAAYEQAARIGEETEQRSLVAEALRRLGVLHHRHNHIPRAVELCQRSYDEAVAIGNLQLAGEALTALGAIDVETGAISPGSWNFQNALALSGGAVELRGRIEQNFGIVAAIRGDYAAARTHFHASVAAFDAAGERHGEVVSGVHLGVLSIRMEELDPAARYLIQAGEIAARTGDSYLLALCDRGSAELLLACRQFDVAIARAESALLVFERLDLPVEQSGACRVLGMIHREVGRPVQAAERLQTALALAIETGWVLGQAEAQRELAILESAAGQSQRALTLFQAAHELFSGLGAGSEMRDLTARMETLVETRAARAS